jgi:hypothetical protein
MISRGQKQSVQLRSSSTPKLALIFRVDLPHHNTKTNQRTRSFTSLALRARVPDAIHYWAGAFLAARRVFQRAGVKGHSSLAARSAIGKRNPCDPSLNVVRPRTHSRTHRRLWLSDGVQRDSLHIISLILCWIGAVNLQFYTLLAMM